MLITMNTRQFHPEATTVATDLPCWHGLSAMYRPGHVLALAGGYAN
jgi:hypothetical protein